MRQKLMHRDAGDDRIVSGGGDDIIIGGAGNDSMHGGGGDDIFCFGSNWGTDTVEQLADGKVTLWFEFNSGSWDETTLTYTDGNNSVTVKGVAAENIDIKLTAVPPTEGAFLQGASESVFEDKNKILLA